VIFAHLSPPGSGRVRIAHPPGRGRGARRCPSALRFSNIARPAPTPASILQGLHRNL